MNIFLYLIIKKVYDYTNSYKNKKQQPFTAITITVYAKKVLFLVSTLSYTVDPIVQLLFIMPFRRDDNFINR